MFGKTTKLWCKDLVHHPTETTINKLLFRVPGIDYIITIWINVHSMTQTKDVHKDVLWTWKKSQMEIELTYMIHVRYIYQYLLIYHKIP